MSDSRPKVTLMRRQPRQARSLERVKQILDVAETLFIKEGYNGTSTNAIAVAAQVSIGSLYQFFPDKAAIIYALAERYNAQLREILVASLAQNANLSLADYIERLVDTVYTFFIEHPGLYAIFIPLQGAFPELEEIEEAWDNLLVRDLALSLRERYPSTATNAYEGISFILVKTIGNLLWIALGQEEILRRELIAEVKRLILCYLQSYFPELPQA